MNSKILSFFWSFINPTNGSALGIIWPRALLTAVLILGMFNPTKKSVFHVLIERDQSDAWTILMWIICMLIVIVYLIACWKTFGAIGKIIILILFAAIAYLALQEGWVSAGTTSLQWMILLFVITYFTFGISGSIIWRKITGQVITDEGSDIF